MHNANFFKRLIPRMIVILFDFYLPAVETPVTHAEIRKPGNHDCRIDGPDLIGVTTPSHIMS